MSCPRRAVSALVVLRLFAISFAQQEIPRAHVVNLEDRPERREAFIRRVQDVVPSDVEFDYSFLRASNASDAQEAIDSGTVRVDPTWRSGSRWGMTLGEVGCFLSHHRLWRKIAAELDARPDKYAIVLEDDAVLSDDFAERIVDVVSSSTRHGAEFVYLAYRFSGALENDRVVVDNQLQSCVFNWWLLAYMISGSAAATLASYSEEYLHSLTPADELLPDFLGTSNRSQKKYFNSVNCFAVRGEHLATPLKGPGSSSSTETGALATNSELEKLDGDADLIVLTAATDPEHFGYQSLKRSATYFGHSLLNVLRGKKWEGYNTKLIWTRKVLESVDSNQLILFVDGYDTMLQSGPDDILRSYNEMVEKFRSKWNCEDCVEPVFFGAEHLCWPSKTVCEQYVNGTSEYSADNPYLNSGTYIGRAGSIRAILEDVDPEKPDDDDQLYYSLKLVAFVEKGTGVPIVLDSDQRLFYALLGRSSDWTISEKSLDYWLYHSNNKDTPTLPAVLHGQGPAKHTLIGITNYLPGAYSDFYGTKQHIHKVVDADSFHPLVVGLFYTELTSDKHERDFISGIKALDVDSSKTTLFVYRHTGLGSDRICHELKKFASCVVSEQADEALARAEFFDYAERTDGAGQALMVDSDVIIARSSAVQDLAGWSRSVVVGHAQRPGKYWANYWTDMDHTAGSQWYKRGFDTLDIYNRARQGLFQVPFGRGLVLVQRGEFKRLADLFSKLKGHGSDTMRRLCLKSTDAGLPLYIDNQRNYGRIYDPDAKESDANDDEEDDIANYGDLFKSIASVHISYKNKSIRIPREKNLSLKDYFQKYAATQTPVIIEDYEDIFREMNTRNIVEVCGDVTASVARKAFGQGKWADLEWHSHGSLKRAMRDIAELNNTGHNGSDSQVVGIFDWSLQKKCPELLNKHFTVPKYFAQDFLQRVPHDKELNYRDVWPSLFMGVHGTYGSIHRDVFGSAFWMFVIEGAKEWHIVNSVEGTDMFSPSGEIRHYHDVVQKGQLLIIPGHQWHQVRNHGLTLSLAGNFVSEGNFDTMKEEVTKNGNDGSYYKQVKNFLLDKDFNTVVDYDLGDLSWHEFRNPFMMRENHTQEMHNECLSQCASEASAHLPNNGAKQKSTKWWMPFSL